MQDEWKVAAEPDAEPRAALRAAGQHIQSLIDLNERILQANGNNPVFALTPVPKTDKNNFQPRVGFNWAPRHASDGMLGMLTGGDKFVVRGGYARTHDYAFLNIALNIASSFPFVAAINRTNLANAFTQLQPTPAGVPAGRSEPADAHRRRGRFPLADADQFSLEFQRQLAATSSLRVGYVGTQGKDLFQTLDGNPRLPFSTQRASIPTRGVIRLRANAAESCYHSLQTGLEKRFSGGLSAGVHYTWSKFIDDGVRHLQYVERRSRGGAGFVRHRQRPRGRRPTIGRTASRATSSRSCRLRDRSGARRQSCSAAGTSAAFFTLQSGAPFTVLNGADPTGALAGIDGAGRQRHPAESEHGLELSNMTVAEIIAAGGAGAVQAAVRQCRRRRAPANASAMSGATRCAPTASATSTSGSSRTRGSPTATAAVPHRDVQRDEHAQLRHPRRTREHDELPQPVGHRWRCGPVWGAVRFIF